ncbi:uncharacterized protein LOC112681361, partial [Sipha flava]|uniref:Uncharacterized protein LOC112681361 n=1 Tax=Sipha flava TaxID=143950 RepID=A0A8B8FAI1_9HEMI
KYVPRMTIPQILKGRTIFDREMSRKYRKLLRFPHRDRTIANLIHFFIESRKEISTYDGIIAYAFGNNLMQYFNATVNHSLLYKHEINAGYKLKAEYYFLCNHQQLVKPIFNLEGVKKIWCFVYGAVFILRLLIL